MRGWSVQTSEELSLLIGGVSLAGQYMMSSAQHIDRFLCRMSTMDDSVIAESSAHDKSRLLLAFEDLHAAFDTLVEVLTQWEEWVDGTTNMGQSQQSLTGSASLPNLKLHGIASFEPELTPGSSET